MPRQGLFIICAILASYFPSLFANPLLQPSALNPPSLENNTSIAANGTTLLSTEERVSETTLALAALSIVAVTYLVLAKHAGYLLNTSKFPSVALEANTRAILEATWPKDTNRPFLLRGETTGCQNAIRLLYLGRLTSESEPYLVAKGIAQCRAETIGKEAKQPLWIAGGSPTMKVIVQLAIWEWISICLMGLTVVITLMHNGFFTKKKGPDSKPRLAVVCIYAGCFIIHAVIIRSLCLQALSRFCAGATWSLLNRAHFAVLDRQFLFEHINDPNQPLEFTEIEKSSTGSTFEPMVYDAALIGGVPPAKIPRTIAQTKTLVAATKQISHDQEKLRVAMNTATEKSLDTVLVNVITMLGICVTQAFSAWTTRPLLENSSTQIGSIALVASAMIGLASMFSSALHLSTTVKAFDQKLSLKEIKINHQALEYVGHLPYRDKVVGFCHGYLTACHVTSRALFRTCSWASMPLALLFGPAFPLLPSANESARCLGAIAFELRVQAMGQEVVFTTDRPRRHSINVTLENVNSINVYCQFKALQYHKASSKQRH